MASYIFERVKNSIDIENVNLIGIDGPTASGKTTTANFLRDELIEKGIPCWVYRLDWSLVDRVKRERDLTKLSKYLAGFEHERELHMDLSRVESFVKDVVKFNQKRISGSKFKNEIELKNLYSRKNNGKCTGSKKVVLKQGMVVILEGHYTLIHKISKYIDFNILLLSEHEELLRRKIERVKTYREPDDAIKYFWKIDLPSFKKHLKYSWINANIVIDNTDYNSPTIMNKNSLKRWARKNDSRPPYSPDFSSLDNIISSIFSYSKLVPDELKIKTYRVIELAKEWDAIVGMYWRVSTKEIEHDIMEKTLRLVNKINCFSSEYEVRLTYTDFFQNAYFRIPPLSMSLGIYKKYKETPCVSIFVDSFSHELNFKIIWGGYNKFKIVRQLGEITKDASYSVEVDDNYNSFPASIPINIILPTDYMIPSFLKKIEYKLIFIKEENRFLSASQAFEILLAEGGVWVYRFSLFSELAFYKNALEVSGAKTIQAGNYLISLHHEEKTLQKSFRSFSLSWEKALDVHPVFKKSHKEIDALIKREQAEAKNFVKKMCKYFIMMDGYLLSQFMYESKSEIKEALHELKSMMLCDNRLLRKRANQYILRYFPMVLLKTNSLWSDLPENATKEISLDDYNRMSPSAMGELYMWMALRDVRGAVLATNIYDIRDKSLDVRAYFQAASECSVPLLVQSSLNAIGHQEVDENGVVAHGYLKVLNGPEDFVNAVASSVKDIYLTTGSLPTLYGIGLDHVAVDYDIPKGRSKRFLNKALKTGKITHFVEDGASLFDVPVRDCESMKKAFDKMTNYSVELIDDVRKTYFVDREICAGELNYVANSSHALIPSVGEMRLFMRSYQEALERKGNLALLSRPMLFVGNMGTTHHGNDRVAPSVYVAKDWRDGLKSENFVSPVLHGTTNTHKDVLQKASDGCHKINVAGDFLKIIIDNLPEKIAKIISDSDIEAKKIIADLRDFFELFSQEEAENIRNALMVKAKDLFSTIQSPKLTSRDSDYFHFNTYSYPEEHVVSIVSAIEKTIESYKTKNFIENDSRSCAFSASMIEVPEEDVRGALIETLWKNGIRYFHIDAGDGEFIARKFTGIKKIQYLREKYADAIIHSHLMMRNPHLPPCGSLSPIQQYIEAGCDAVSIHPRSFTNFEEIFSSLAFIRGLGCKPGIVIEVDDDLDRRMKSIITEANLDWVVVMGVPIGYGGQTFQFKVLKTISDLNFFFSNTLKKNDFLIEVDGGLTFQTLELSRNAGGRIFSGWSIIKSNNLKVVTKKIGAVSGILK